MYYNQIEIANDPNQAGTPVAKLSPLYEVSSPQYPLPNAYDLANLGYRRNSLVFTCTQKWMAAISEPELKVYKGRGKNKTEQKNHPLLELMHQPNEAMGQVEFWMATQCYLDIAGFSVWEKEYNRLGEVIALWPMRPDWCSFKRGDARPLQYVRYQPYGGIPFVDVPIERCLVFMEFDPLYPMLKGLSRTAVAMREIGVDNAATDFMALFWQHGAQVNGILKTKQSLEEAEAMRMKAMWRQQHGGAGNWQDITVMGSDVDYVPTQMNFKDMDLENVDGRTESRICGVMRIDPILVGAKVGLGTKTFNSYAEARKAWYEENVIPSWRWLQSEVTQQLLVTDFGGETGETTEFDISEVKALQEDRDAKWKRAGAAAAGNWVTRDEARQEAGLDPIDHADVFVGVTIRATSASTDATAVGGEMEDPAQAQGAITGQPVPGQPAASPAAQFNGLIAQQQQHAALRKQAVANPGKAVGAEFDDELVECKTAKDVRAVFERHYPKAAKTDDELAEAVAELRRFREMAES